MPVKSPIIENRPIRARQVAPSNRRAALDSVDFDNLPTLHEVDLDDFPLERLRTAAAQATASKIRVGLNSRRLLLIIGEHLSLYGNRISMEQTLAIVLREYIRLVQQGTQVATSGVTKTKTAVKGKRSK